MRDYPFIRRRKVKPAQNKRKATGQGGSCPKRQNRGENATDPDLEDEVFDQPETDTQEDPLPFNSGNDDDDEDLP